MQFARLAIFILAAVAGQVASVRIERPADPSVGLKTDDSMVAAYCNHEGNVPAGLYACFRLNGDIRKRMQSADDSVKGFVNTAGNSEPPPSFSQKVDVNTDIGGIDGGLSVCGGVQSRYQGGGVPYGQDGCVYHEARYLALPAGEYSQ